MFTRYAPRDTSLDAAHTSVAMVTAASDPAHNSALRIPRLIVSSSSVFVIVVVSPTRETRAGHGRELYNPSRAIGKPTIPNPNERRKPGRLRGRPCWHQAQVSD